MDIASRLKYFREKKEISIYKLSKLSEVSSTYIHELESGEKQPTVLILKKICDALDISLSAFFGPLNNHNKLMEPALEYDLDTMTPELKDLIESVMDLTPEQLIKLTEFVRSMK